MEAKLRSARESINIAVPFPEIKRVRYGQRGAKQWPNYMWELIMGHLVNGTSPSAIAQNIKIDVEMFSPTTKIVELPSIWTCRRGRTVLLVVCQTLACYRLAKADKWGQLFTDGTGRRQQHYKDLLISVEEDHLFK